MAQLERDYTSFSLLFTNVTPILTLAQNKSLEISDLGSLPRKACVHDLHEKFAANWADELALKPEVRSLWRAIFKSIGYGNFILAFFLQIVASGSIFQAPLLMKAINNSNAGVNVLSRKEYWVLVSLTLVVPIVGTICAQQARSILQFMGMQCRNLLAACIFHKTLKRKSSQLETGLVTNLFVNDVKSIELVAIQFTNVFTMPGILAAGLALIYTEVGNAMFVGLGYIIGNAIPLTVSLVIFVHFFLLFFQRADKRIKLTSEVVSGIRIIKYNAWEVSM